MCPILPKDDAVYARMTAGAREAEDQSGGKQKSRGAALPGSAGAWPQVTGAENRERRGAVAQEASPG